MAHHTTSYQLTDTMRNCIEACGGCHDTCEQTLSYCLEQGGDHASAGHIRLMLDCSQVCRATADVMLRASTLHERLCALCAEVCDLCADDCERFDDDRMRACATVCRRCADACRQTAGSAA